MIIYMVKVLTGEAMFLIRNYNSMNYEKSLYRTMAGKLITYLLLPTIIIL